MVQSALIHGNENVKLLRKAKAIDIHNLQIQKPD
jgi:hypothetical protein